jgi:hypothetical protein
MNKNGRKWTIGRFVEITKNNKTEDFRFDEITDEGGGSSMFVIVGDNEKLSLKNFIDRFMTVVAKRFS